MSKSKTQFIIRFNTNKYWGGFRSFVKHWYQAHPYTSKVNAIKAAKHVILRRRQWYNNTELLGFEIIECEATLKNVLHSETI